MSNTQVVPHNDYAEGYQEATFLTEIAPQKNFDSD
jgi:hypothetical protein